MNAKLANIDRLDAPTLGWLLLLAFAIGIYAMGLDGQYIPSNGDEMVYTHIARLTAASGHWLPLVSELDHMRNTKPPLLFWQAIVAGDWGQRWQLWALRTPSLIYTLLLTGAVAYTVRRITRSTRSACIAACVYLGFFCTFRYGRPFLTSAPETFWFSLPLFGLLWHRLGQPAAGARNSLVGAVLSSARPAASASRWKLLAPVGWGLALGLGLAYKSFALIAPAAAAWWCAELLSEPRPNWRAVFRTTLRVSVSAIIALGVFALWFVLDPDPTAVWLEFVIGENASKLSNSQGYWHAALLGGGSSMWAQLLAYVQNAGLLAFVVLGLAWAGWQSLRQRAVPSRRSPHVLILLAWLAVWLLVFTLPSQRSARYVIPAMPALAMLIALYWPSIARGWFVLTLALASLPMLILARIGWVAHGLGMGNSPEFVALLLAALLGAATLAAGVLKPAWTRACAATAVLTVYAIFNLAVLPLDGRAGRYGPEITARLHGARIAVPNGFNGQFERFEFLLPGNHFLPYDAEGRAANSQVAPSDHLQQLLVTHDAVVWAQAEPTELAPPCTPACVVLASRWHLKGRHQSGEIELATLWYPQAWLFRREWLVTRATLK
jgi:4-amino-4-deoxy-L-arabinose transferase-like glycosyltransferase